MNIEINVSDYLSEEEIKEECKTAIRHCIFEQYKKESQTERLITNLSYEFVFKAIQETTGEDALQKVKDTVKELVRNKSTISYELFKKADAWDMSESVGQKILTEAITENEPLIKEKVKEAINGYDFLSKRDLQTRMEDLFHEMLEEKLFGGEDNDRL